LLVPASHPRELLEARRSTAGAQTERARRGHRSGPA